MLLAGIAMPHGPIEHFTTDFADIIMWTDFHLFDLTFRGIALTSDPFTVSRGRCKVLYT